MTIDERATWDEENQNGYDAFEQFDADIRTPGLPESEQAAEQQPRDPQNQQQPAASDAERLASLFESMPTRRKVLLGALGLCRQPQPADGLAQRVDQLQALNHSVFSGATLIGLLEQAGGLRHINEDGSPYAPRDGNADASDTEDESSSGAKSGAGSDERCEGCDEECGEEYDEECEVEFLEVEQAAPTFWVTTEAGLAALEADDPRARLEQLLEDDVEFVSAYREVLEALADGPLTKPQIDIIVKSNASAQAGHRLGGYFVDRLERADAIEWTGAWAITDLGREALDLEALYR